MTFAQDSHGPFAVEVVNVAKKYGDVVALNDVTLTIGQGEIFGLLGPNGAGKTTLLRTLTALVAPSSGTVRVLGVDVPRDYPSAAAEISAAIGEPAVYRTLPARDNVRAAALLSARDATPAQIDEALEVVGLGDVASRPARTFSSGMVQRLAVAMALITRPRLLLLDEPTNGMDPRALSEMRALFARLRDEGATIVLSSHQMHEVEALADRVAFLSHGRVVALGEPSSLIPSTGTVHLTVRNVRAATRALRAAGLVVSVDGDGTLACDATVEDALRALFDAGIVPTGVREERPTLTDLFLALEPARELA